MLEAKAMAGSIPVARSNTTFGTSLRQFAHESIDHHAKENFGWNAFPRLGQRTGLRQRENKKLYDLACNGELDLAGVLRWDKWECDLEFELSPEDGRDTMEVMALMVHQL